MTNYVKKTAALSIALIFVASASEAAARLKVPKHPPLEVPIAGTVAAGGTFAGTLSLQEFVARDGQVFAIGMVRGTVKTAAGIPLGTVVSGPRAFPVQVGPGAAASAPVDGSAIAPQQICELLQLDIGAVTLDLLGLQVTTLPIDLDLLAEGSGTNVIGHLICTILETVNNVLGLVDLLNLLLGLLTGLV